MHVRTDTITGLVTSEGNFDTIKHTVSSDLWLVLLATCHTEILRERRHVQENMQHQNVIPRRTHEIQRQSLPSF